MNRRNGKCGCPYSSLRKKLLHDIIKTSRSEMPNNPSSLYVIGKQRLLCSSLCGRPIGRIMRLARPSVRPSVRLSVPYRFVSGKRKKRRKIKIGTHVPHGTNKWSANFQLKGSKVKVTGRKNLQNLASCLLSGSSAGGSSEAGTDCKLLGLRHC